MNINLIRLKGVILELRGIRVACERLAECWETQLAQDGINIRPPKADTSGPEPTFSSVDEEMDWAREQIEFLKREDARAAKEDEG